MDRDTRSNWVNAKEHKLGVDPIMLTLAILAILSFLRLMCT